MKAKAPTIAASLPPSRGVGRVQLNGFQIILLLLGVVMVLLIAVYLEEDLRGSAAWRGYEADAIRRGVKLTMAEMIPPPVPDAENFARLPIFNAAFQAAAKRERIPDPFEWFGAIGVQSPKSLVNLQAWQTHFVTVKFLPAAGDDPAADVLKVLDRFAGPFAEIRSGRSRRHCRLPVDWLDINADAFPYMLVADEAARASALRLSAHLAKGDSSAAYEDFADGLHMGIATLQEPSLNVALTRFNIAEKMVDVMGAGLAAHQWGEPELRKIEEDLAALDWLQDYLHVISSDRVDFNKMMDAWMVRPELPAYWFFSHGMHYRPGIRDKSICAFYPAGWIYQSKVRGNRYADELAARIDVSGRRWLSSRSIPSNPPGGLGGVGEFTNFPFNVIRGLEAQETQFLRMAATTDEARLACALERFRMAQGHYPASLNELAPAFIRSIPAQIVDGKPYHYRVEDDGSFVLYSVTTELLDHGGVLLPGMPARKQLDWIWPYSSKEHPSP